MKRLEFVLNGITVPLENPRDLGLRVNKIVSDDNNIDARGGTFTWTIKLPWTPQLVKALGSSFDAQQIDKFNKGFQNRVEVFIDSDLELSGLFSQRERDDDYVYGEIYSDDIWWAQQIAGKSLREIKSFPDLEFMPFDNGFNFYINEFDDRPGRWPITWALNAYGVFPKVPPLPPEDPEEPEPPADTTIDNILHPFQFDDYPPSFHYLTIIKKIFEDIGWTAKGKVFQDAKINHLILPYIGELPFLWNWAKLAWAKWVRATDIITTAGPIVNFTVSDDTATYQVVSNRCGIRVRLTYTPGNTSPSTLLVSVYNPKESVFKQSFEFVPPSSNPGVTVTRTYENTVPSFPDQNGGQIDFTDIVLRATVGGSPVDITQRVYIRVHGSDNGNDFDYLDFVDFVNENIVYYKLGERISETNYDYLGNQTYSYQAYFDVQAVAISDVLVKEVLVPGDAIVTGDILRIQEVISDSVIDFIAAQIDVIPDTSEFLQVAPNLPDIEQKSFVKTFINQFNLYFDVNTDHKTITFYNQGEYFKEPDYVVQLDQVADIKKRKESPVAVLKRLSFLYTPDTEDYLTTGIQDKYNYYQTNTSLQASGENTIQALFSATESKTFRLTGTDKFNDPRTLNLALATIADRDALSTPNVEIIWRYNYVPRLLEWKGKAGIPGTTDPDIPTLPLYLFMDVFSGEESDKIFVTTAEFPQWLYWKSLFEVYYKTRQNPRGHIITIGANLTRDQAKKLRDRFNVQIANDTYRLISMDAYDPLGFNETSIKLEKIV